MNINSQLNYFGSFEERINAPSPPQAAPAALKSSKENLSYFSNHRLPPRLDTKSSAARPMSSLQGIDRVHGATLQLLALNPTKLSAFISSLIEQDSEYVDQTLKTLSEQRSRTVFHFTCNTDLSPKVKQNIQRVAAQFANIDGIAFSNFLITDEDLLETLSYFRRLAEVSIANGLLLTPSGLQKALRSTMLQKFTILGPTLNDHFFEALTNQHQEVRVLHVRECAQLKLNSMNIPTLSNLTELDISGSNATDSGLLRCIDACPALQSLSLENCLSLSDEGFFQQANFGRQFRKLLATNTKIADAGASAIITKTGELSCLILTGCQSITTEGFRAFFFTESLKEFDASATHIDERGVRNVFTRAKWLERLALCSCPLLKAHHFASFEYPDSLQVIDFSESLIDERGVHTIAKRCHDLRVLFLEECEYLPEDLTGTKGIKHQTLCKLLDTEPGPIFDMEP